MNLQFEFTSSPAPVQAEGTIEGRPFYFRARGDNWAFTVAERDGDDPAALGQEDVALGTAWRRSGTVPGNFAASWMSLDHATSLIQECARTYINEHRG